LAKLTIKAIILMEDVGGQVVGLTFDGASTNRTMWSQLRVILHKYILFIYICQVMCEYLKKNNSCFI